jgi:molybdopterin molybdotransferase
MALIPVEEALARVLAMVHPLPTESVAIDEAVGRALAEPVVAARTLPPWDNSAMDGYAVRSGDTGPRRVTETIFAGQAPHGPLGPGTAARIMTGAQVPPGADAVVMQEKTTRDGDLVTLTEPVAAGANIRRRGEDVAQGARLFDAGTIVGLAEAGALWGQGLERVAVRRRPRVAIASSGDELCDVGALEEGKIVDTNSPVIAAAARRAGATVSRLGRAPDSLEAMTALFARGLEGHDVLITLAGASVGERDFTRDALTSLGVTIDFWKVAMKPGKPLALGRRGETLVFGLPGNPVSAMVTFELFVRPALRALQGLPPAAPQLPGRAAVDLPKSGGLRLFLRATTEVREGAIWATPLGTQSSGAMRSATGASCLIVLPPETGPLPKGSEIALLPLDWGNT